MNAPATRPVMNGYRTMRMLHWSSISFGYMKPCTLGTAFLLAHGAVEAVVEHLRVCRHLRLQHMHHVRPQDLVNPVARVLEVAQVAPARRAHLHARRLQPLRDAVVAQRALV